MSSPRRVLIIDDDRDLAESLGDVVSAHGHTVELAFGGVAGMAKFRESNFDIVFVDVKMPGMSGVEAFLEFRRLKPGVKVVRMTAHSVEHLLREAIESRSLSVLRDSCTPGEVIGALHLVRRPGVVLVAGDVARRFEPALARDGRRVTVATTAHEALDRCLAGGVDGLVLDAKLPILTGVDVYLSLRWAGVFLPATIIANAQREGKEPFDLLRPMADAILSKPFDPELLLREIDALRQKAA